MNARWLCRALLLLVLVGSAAAGAAAPLARGDVPDALKSWVPWVLDDDETLGCPHLFNDGDSRRCAWPGAIDLKATAGGASFGQEWQVHRETWVPLPGDDRHWPLGVETDGKPAAVLNREGVPSVRLAPGSHRVSGRFAWPSLPESLALPDSTGLVRLELAGQPVAQPVRDDARLWLQRNVNAEGEEQAQVQVHRKVVDGVPIKVETRIRLEIAGKSRELVVGRALLAGLIPVDLVSPLPASLGQDGSLKVQARAGTWDLVLVARHPGSAKTFRLPAGTEGLAADEEVWAFEAAPMVRSASIEGPPAVDPQQTTLPRDWHGLPAYLMKGEVAFNLKELRRGDSDPAPDRLSLQRRLWLSFDGTTMTLRDHIRGQVSQASRLEMGPGAQLGRVDVAGQDQLITRGDRQLAGIELRRGELAMTADSLVPDAGRSFSAVGWQHDFDKVEIALALPAGWQLLYAGGADRSAGAWLTRWNLLHIFLVLVTALAVGQLWGRGWGGLALVLLVLSFHEQDAPRYAWLMVLALVALTRFVPAGRFRTVLGWLERAGMLVLILLSLGFAAAQVRSALYPVLAYEERVGTAMSEPAAEEREHLQSDAPVPAAAAPLEAEQKNVGGNVEPSARMRDSLAKSSKLNSIYSNQSYQAVDPRAKVQTGPGLPDWEGQYQLSWDGPVRQGQVLDLWLLPPWGHQVLVVLRLVLLVALLACMAEVPLGRWRRRGGGAGGQDAGAAASQAATWSAAMLLALCATVLPSGSVQAQMPDEALLGKLREKLTRPADCLPDCAEISRLSVNAAGTSLRLGLDIDAATDTAVPLPGGAKYWIPHEARLDGKTAYVHRDDDGALWLLVPAGSHRLELNGDLPARDTLQLPLPRKPRHVEVSAAGWDVAGLSDDTGAGDTFQLTRRRQAGSETAEAPALPPFLRVERRLVLDLLWRVETTVRRESPLGVAALAQVPLLPGESVTSQGINVKDGAVLVNLGPQAESLTWSSTLQQAATLALSAPKDTAWAETWTVSASTLWHVAHQGIPPVATADGSGADLVFLPWPGETLKMKIDRPQPVPGQTLTVDNSRLEVSPGARATDYLLSLVLRSSRGQDHRITLPAGASLQSVSINGQVRPIRATGRDVLLPILPGKQRIDLAWRAEQGITSRFATQAIDLNIPTVNNRIELKVPGNRWLLLAGGPGIGPAILFWGTLLVMLAVSLVLGRLRGLPVKTWQWVLLALGLTQVPWWSAALVVGWFFAVARRGQAEPGHETRRSFNLRQLGLAFLTLAALATLLAAVLGGLLGRPEMQVAGNNSSFQLLRWYADRVPAELPSAWMLTLPMLVYRGLMLAWALWLAWSLLGWLKWGWSAFGRGGFWRGRAVAPAATADA